MTAFFQSLGMSYEWAWFVATICGILLIALPLMLAVAMIIYVDRKVWAAINLRRGPNVVGPFGLLQSFADGLKVFLQETIIPSAANKGMFLLAPIVTFTVALAAWAVIPFDAGVVLADINVGLLYILAISSLSVYGVVMSGLGVQLQISVLLRHARRRADDFLRSLDRLHPGLRGAVGRHVQSDRHRRWRSRATGSASSTATAFNLLLFPMWVMFFISAWRKRSACRSI